MNEQLDLEAALISAILFLENEPLSEEKLARIAGFTLEQTSLALQRICSEFDQPVHGFAPIKKETGWIFAPKLVFWEQLKDHYGKKKRDETLARCHGNPCHYCLLSTNHSC